MRLMSFALTTPQVVEGTKTVTRRLGWGGKRTGVKVGEVLMAIEKGQGIPKGERVRRIRPIRVVSVSREPLREILDWPFYGAREVEREGFPMWSRQKFVDFFCKANKCTPRKVITRIEFEYVT